MYFARRLFALGLLTPFPHSLVSSNDVRRLLLWPHYAALIFGQLFAGVTPCLAAAVLSPPVTYRFLQAEARLQGTILGKCQEHPTDASDAR